MRRRLSTCHGCIQGYPLRRDCSSRLRRACKHSFFATSCETLSSFAHMIRTVKFSQLRKYQLRDLNHYTVMGRKDYMGKLEARKSQQGTSENLGR